MVGEQSPRREFQRGGQEAAGITTR